MDNLIDIHNNTLTLKQGMKFKKSQGKIMKNAERKLEHTGRPQTFSNAKEGLENPQQSDEYLQKRRDLINHVDNTVITQVQQLKDLQTNYKNVLDEYNKSLENMKNATDSYVQTTNDTTNYKNSNVYVGRLFNDPATVTSSYVGSFNNNNTMNVIPGDANYNYSTCKEAALNNGYNIFGLTNTGVDNPCAQYNADSKNVSDECYEYIWKRSQCTTSNGGNDWAKEQTMNGLINDSWLWATMTDDEHRTGCYGTSNPSSVNTSSAPDYNINSFTSPAMNTSQCVATNDLNSATSGGIYRPKCSVGTDGNSYGGAWANSVYSISDSDNSVSYVGCFNDDSTRAMEPMGPKLDQYEAVFVLTSPPWSISQFPNNTGAQWIWYTIYSAINAPVNNGNPVTLIYNYKNDSGSILDVILWAICDDYADIYLNSQIKGQVSGGWDGAGSPSQIPIQLMPGDNFIEAAVVNGGGPAGFILAAVLTSNPSSVIFTTNGDWKWTTASVSNLISDPQNASYDTCKAYAIENKKKYFGLQNGDVGTAQCFVSNDLAHTQMYGSGVQSFKLTDGNIYGGTSVTAVYQATPQADINLLGKAGYVDETGTLTEYPADMVTNNTSGVPSVANNASCNKDVNTIDTKSWEKYPKNRTFMNANTKCGLSNATTSQLQQTEALKQKLTTIAEQLVDKINYLETLNVSMLNQAGMDKTVLDRNLNDYKKVINNLNNLKTTDMINIDGILADTETNVLMENYNYMFWGILALAIIIITIHATKK